MRKYIFIVLVFFLFSLLADEDSHFIQKVSDGSIDWEEKTVTITGSGVPDVNIRNINSARLYSERVALRNAKYRLAKVLDKVLLSGKITVSDYMKKRSDLTFEQLGAKSQMEKISSRYYSDGAVDLVLKFSIKDSLQEVCDRYYEELKKNFNSVKVVRNLPVDEKVLKSELVIEVKKKDFRPKLFPRVVTTSGDLLYGIEMLDNYHGGSVRYLKKTNAKDILIIKAKNVNENSEIVVREEDILKIKTQLKKNVFRDRKVTVILK